MFIQYKLSDTNTYFSVNSAENLVITVWEDFGQLVGGAGGVCVCVRERREGYMW